MLKLVARRTINKDIEQLFISPNTVKDHVSNVWQMFKLHFWMYTVREKILDLRAGPRRREIIHRPNG